MSISYMQNRIIDEIDILFPFVMKTKDIEYSFSSEGELKPIIKNHWKYTYRNEYQISSCKPHYQSGPNI